jgi:hypothetical protein
LEVNILEVDILEVNILEVDILEVNILEVDILKMLVMECFSGWQETVGADVRGHPQSANRLP